MTDKLDKDYFCYKTEKINYYKGYEDKMDK